MPQAIKINVEANQTVPLESLEPFQGNLKRIEKAQYEKLRNVLIEQGVSFAVHIWQNKGKNHIIDGHQRVFVLKQMKEIERFEVPDIPVAIVKAKSYKEAKLKVLAGASQFGKLDKAGLKLFMDENSIVFDDLVANFDFPEIDFDELGADFMKAEPEEKIDEPAEDAQKNLPSGSDQVRQVQLFFNAEAHAEFIDKIQFLSTEFGKENITDAVMECVRESYKAAKPT